MTVRAACGSNPGSTSSKVDEEVGIRLRSQRWSESSDSTRAEISMISNQIIAEAESVDSEIPDR
jgi:hypothetical protein